MNGCMTTNNGRIPGAFARLARAGTTDDKAVLRRGEEAALQYADTVVVLAVFSGIRRAFGYHSHKVEAFSEPAVHGEVCALPVNLRAVLSKAPLSK